MSKSLYKNKWTRFVEIRISDSEQKNKVDGISMITTKCRVRT